MGVGTRTGERDGDDLALLPTRLSHLLAMLPLLPESGGLASKLIKAVRFYPARAL